MNLRRIANRHTRRINPNIAAIWLRNEGYETRADGTRYPHFEEAEVEIQVQAVSGDTLAFVNGLNIQGVLRSVYMYEESAGANVKDVRGGDILIFPERTGQDVKEWKVVTVAEPWDNWTHVIVVLQDEEHISEE